jgi:site-specific recombinase XerD
MGEIENMTSVKKPKSKVDPIVNDFRAHLEAEKISANTIKNYVSDVRQFLTWLESNNQIPDSKL